MTEQYDILKSYLEAGEELSFEEWEKFFVSGKALVNARLYSWRDILKIEDRQAEGSVRRDAAKRCREKVEKEIRDMILEVLDHMEDYRHRYSRPAAQDERLRDLFIKYLDVITDKHDLRLEMLPVSVLSRVFSFLYTDSLKAVRLVSR